MAGICRLEIPLSCQKQGILARKMRWGIICGSWKIVRPRERAGVGDGHSLTSAPVVQRIEWRFPEPLVQVRFLSGAPSMPQRAAAARGPGYFFSGLLTFMGAELLPAAESFDLAGAGSATGLVAVGKLYQFNCGTPVISTHLKPSC